MTTHPAARAAHAAMGAVTTGDRESWLACFAEDAVLFDPVGGSPFDPTGAGLHGRAAMESFWDLGIAPNEVSFEIAGTHTGGQEAAVVASVTLKLATGASATYDGVFVYAVDAAGKVISLRAFWDVERVLAVISAAPADAGSPTGRRPA